MKDGRSDRPSPGRPSGPSVGVVGCGNLGAGHHLPRLLERSDCRVTHLVDAHLERAASLAARHSVPVASTEHAELLADRVEAAIVAVPNALHAPVAAELLRGGVHVLVEEPMATDVGGCDEMLEASRQGNAVLAVGHLGRFARSVRFARGVLDAGILGDLRSVEIQEGLESPWPVAPDALPWREWTGGGVLVDLGAHALGVLGSWMEDTKVLDYRDDAAGGVEADARVRLHTDAGVTATVDLSRTRVLSGTGRLVGELGRLEVELWGSGASLRLGDDVLRGEVVGPAERRTPARRDEDLFRAEHDDFFRAIRQRREPAVTGEEGRRVVERIARCYAARRPWVLPWSPFTSVTADSGRIPGPVGDGTWVSPAVRF